MGGGGQVLRIQASPARSAIGSAGVNQALAGPGALDGEVLTVPGKGFVVGASGHENGVAGVGGVDGRLDGLACRDREGGGRRALAEALLYTGIAAREKGEPAQAISLLTEGLEEARQCGWMRGCAMTCMNLGLCAMQTDTERARFLMEEGL